MEVLGLGGGVARGPAPTQATPPPLPGPSQQQQQQEDMDVLVKSSLNPNASDYTPKVGGPQ